MGCNTVMNGEGRNLINSDSVTQRQSMWWLGGRNKNAVVKPGALSPPAAKRVNFLKLPVALESLALWYLSSQLSALFSLHAVSCPHHRGNSNRIRVSSSGAWIPVLSLYL